MSLAPLLPLVTSLMSMIGSATLALAPGAASNTSPTRGLVIVLRPVSVDELTRTALARVTGELAAARFQVSVLPLDSAQDPTAQVETVALESNAIAAFAIAHVADGNLDTIAIWVCDRLGRRTTIERMTIRGDNLSQEAEVLAVEAIELIRASIAGLWPMPTRTTPADLDAAGSAARARRPDFSVGLGAAMLKDLDGPAPQWMAAITGMARWPGGPAVRAQLIGLGPAVTADSVDGSAAIRRAVLSLGPAWIFQAGEKVDFFVSMAAGAEHIDATGATADPALDAHGGSGWMGVVSAGAGAGAKLGEHVSLFASIDALWTWPRLDLLIGSTRTAPFSRPGALANAGLQANF